ncbi:MAG: hypothetical protein IPL61_33750 [Myxococcales bacterium]|nr:hypothetical protein [Myxococcales bacterium]
MAATPEPARVPVAWAPRAEPLAPRAVIATGAVAAALGRRLAQLDDAALAALTAVAARGALVVLGDGAALPWVEGVTYLGRAPAAPELLVPTALAPTVPAPVLVRALTAWLDGRAVAWPLALAPAPLRVVPCGGARAIERARLTAWLAAEVAA